MMRSHDEPIARPTEGDVRRRISEIRQLADGGHFEPAFLMAWGTMEGVARAVAPDMFVKVQTPGRIVETLAMDGYIMPSEADAVRRLVHKRNKLIHGQLDVSVDRTEIEDFVGTIERLYQLVPA